MTEADIVEFPSTEIPQYSVIMPNEVPGRNSGIKGYTEVVPEVLAKHNSNADKFTEEFVRLMKGE